MAELKKDAEQDDPMELMGMLAPGDADSDLRQAEALIQEFMLMGYDRQHLLALFREPHYQATHRLWKTQGEAYVQELIDREASAWRREVPHV